MTESIAKPEPTSEQKTLARATFDLVAKGKKSLPDLWATLRNEVASTKVVERAAPRVPALTEEQQTALKRLPEVYGSVVPLKDRALTVPEQAKIVEEREVIDTLLGFLSKRKDESIRETLANHLDNVLTVGEGEEPPPTDAKGHFQIKQEVPVEGTGKKIQKTVSNPKPVLTAAAVEEAHEKGLIDRATYLAITKKPEVARVLDEDGLVKAMKKDPSLMFTLNGLTTIGSPTITIKVVPDK